MANVHGYTATGFEPVRDVFQANFDSLGEVGAAFSAYHQGRKVVDLWGGIRDTATGDAWNEDTLVLVFSTTKGATAMCVNQLIDRGLLDAEQTVAHYWPEFAANGKADITVAQLMSHQGGLAWIEDKLPFDDVLAWDPVVRALEATAPHWEPGTRHGYHATTYGWLAGELVRRVSGQTVGTYLRDEIAAPLGAEFHIGLPATEEGRVAPLISMLPKGLDFNAPSERDDNMMSVLRQFMGPDTVLGKALTSPGGAFADLEVFNHADVHAAEIPAANGITDARSIARLYSACIGEVDGYRIMSQDTLDRAITQRTVGGNMVLFDLDIQFGLGFMLRSSLLTIGGPRAFGHFGMGGSVGWADPDAELAFGYVMNKMELGVTGDQRSTNLVNAVYACAG